MPRKNGKTDNQHGRRVKMKKTITVLAILFFIFIGTANALDWHTANQATIGWNPVTTLADGNPIPPGSVIAYQTYLANAVTDPTKQNPTDTGIVDTNEKIYTLTIEGKYFVGVQTLREVDGETIMSSYIAWSDIAEFCLNGVTFGLRFYLIPDNIEGLYPH